MPIQWKFLGVLVVGAMTLAALGALALWEPGRRLVRGVYGEAQQTRLEGAVAALQLGVERRVKGLATLGERLELRSDEGIFAGVPFPSSEEVIALSLYRKRGGEWVRARRFENRVVLGRLRAADGFSDRLDKDRPVASHFGGESDVGFLNRSVPGTENDTRVPVGVFSMILGSRYLPFCLEDCRLVADLATDKGFLANRVGVIPGEDFLLIDKGQKLVFHSEVSAALKGAEGAFKHPILGRVESGDLTRGAIEIPIEGKLHWTRVVPTGYGELHAGLDATPLVWASSWMGFVTRLFAALAVVFLVTTILMTFLGDQITRRLFLLRRATETIADGNLSLRIPSIGKDEVGRLGESLQTLATKLKPLVGGTAVASIAAPDVEPGETGKLRAALLRPSRIDSAAVEVSYHSAPSEQYTGSFWDTRIHGGKLTIAVGDAAGKGELAGMGAAIARSCFATLMESRPDLAPLPAETMSAVNRVLHDTGQGKLMVSLVVAQIDLESGGMDVCAAGQHGPLRLRLDEGASRGGLEELLPLAGERLGFNPNTTFESMHIKLEHRDVLLFTTEAFFDTRDRQGHAISPADLEKECHLDPALTVAQIRADIEGMVKDHVGEDGTENDIAFFLLRWKHFETHVKEVEEQTLWAKAPAEKSQTGDKVISLEDEKAIRDRYQFEDKVA